MGTVKVRYTGISDVVSFKKADFDRSGVEDQGAVTFRGNGDVQEISESALALLTNDAHNFPLEVVETDANSEPLSTQENTDPGKPEGDASATRTTTGRRRT